MLLRHPRLAPLAPPQYSPAFLAALAGLMFGLDIGVISGASQFIQKDFQVPTM